eukprot:TRINITY_DN2440_c0_g1_i5.p1 TRINITY_DN2440_c0_g1~~TRINITY_DN2440_c0_g1_i5.p1  ORF type:complete len:213 (+),score=31.58 TRINITY_DN2440_c0_g1_i5:879-1517(+)
MDKFRLKFSNELSGIADRMSFLPLPYILSGELTDRQFRRDQIYELLSRMKADNAIFLYCSSDLKISARINETRSTRIFLHSGKKSLSEKDGENSMKIFKFTDVESMRETADAIGDQDKEKVKEQKLIENESMESFFHLDKELDSYDETFQIPYSFDFMTQRMIGRFNSIKSSKFKGLTLPGPNRFIPEEEEEASNEEFPNFCSNADTNRKNY